MLLTRRRFLLSVGAVGAAVGSDAFLIEPNRLQVTEHMLGESLQPGRPKVRFVQVSDLHLQRVNAHAQQIAEEVNRQAPDFVVITGDSIDRPNHLGELGDLLDLFTASTPKYAILGNWEYQCFADLPALAKVYAARNCRLLVNETAEHWVGESRLLITGLDDWMGGQPSIDRALYGVEPSGNHLLLMHCPGYREMLPRVLWEPRETGGQEAYFAATELPASPGFRTATNETMHHIDYMLSGHTHGGQITFFGAAPVTPVGSGRYVKGWYRDGGPALYVSRGLGTTTIPARFCALPELPVFEWTLA